MTYSKKRLNRKQLDLLGRKGKERHATNISIVQPATSLPHIEIKDREALNEEIAYEDYILNIRDDKETSDEQNFNKSTAEDILNSVSDVKPAQKSLLLNSLSSMAEQYNVKIDYEIFSSQALASQMGILLELVYERKMKTLTANNPNVSYIRGYTIAADIKAMRKNSNENEVYEFKQKLIKDYKFAPKYVNDIISNKSSKPIRLPDLICIINKDGKVTIKCAEMKASGQNDSSSVPKNIEKLAYGTKNSALEPYAGSVEVERAILIIAAHKNKNGNFLHTNAWKNQISQEQSQLGDIKVLANEEAFEWISGFKISEEEYQNEFINTAAYVELMRIQKFYKNNKETD